MRVMVYMDKLYRESGNRCHFTALNADNKPLIGLVWPFTKNWRYTQAVNHRSVIYYYLSISRLQNKILNIVNHCDFILFL